MEVSASGLHLHLQPQLKTRSALPAWSSAGTGQDLSTRIQRRVRARSSRLWTWELLPDVRHLMAFILRKPIACTRPLFTTAEMPILSAPWFSSIFTRTPQANEPVVNSHVGTRRPALAARAGVLQHTSSHKYLSVLLRERNLDITINMRLFMYKVIAVT